jgi:hypothetical protein
MRARRVSWQTGPASPGDEVVVSVTDYRTHRWYHVPGVWLNGLRLRRAWPRMEGAVGLWLWAEPGTGRSGSIAVWRGEEDLRRFVGWDVHVRIMRAYRDRGTLLASSWRRAAGSPAEIWADGRRRVRAARAEAAR